LKKEKNKKKNRSIGKREKKGGKSHGKGKTLSTRKKGEKEEQKKLLTTTERAAKGKKERGGKFSHRKKGSALIVESIFGKGKSPDMEKKMEEKKEKISPLGVEGGGP